MKEPLLLVDDEPDMLRMLKTIFEDNYEPILASTADEAVSAMDRRPDCRIGMIDLRLPGDPGQSPEQVGASLIRRFTARPDRAAIGFSAERQLEGIARAAGATKFLVKGAIHDEDIAAAVTDLQLRSTQETPPDDEGDYLWFLTESEDCPRYAGQVVVLCNRKVVGSGATHRSAWESVVAAQTQGNGATLSRDGCDRSIPRNQAAIRVSAAVLPA